jgi:uncharacterized protein
MKMSTYFSGKGSEFTKETARLAVARAKELGITEFVIASNLGPSARALIEELGGDGSGVAVVTHAAGFKEPFSMEMGDVERTEISRTGASVITAGHALSGVERGLSSKHQGSYPALIMADTLRLFGQGMKVAVECAVMAADAGALSGGRIVSIGGSGRGADTAVVMTPGHAAKIFEQATIHEIICKPGLY